MAGRASSVTTGLPPAERRRATRVLQGLDRMIPDPVCELDHHTPWELLVATILSAQCTDARVNQVTPALFRRYPDPAALAAAEPGELEGMIRSTGFFRNKAKSLLGAARALVTDFGGAVPRTMDELLTLPGVARKTANVLLGTAFGRAEGIVVDTHARRVSHRLGLTAERDPGKIERDLMARFPKRRWIRLGHQLVLHGRYTCLARAPRCGDCALAPVCPSVE